MSYTFTLTEQTEIEAAYALGSQAIGDTGNFKLFYSKVAEILTTDNGGGAPDTLPGVLKPRIWIEGALNVNINEGAFAAMIRGYAIREGYLHYGETFTNLQMQEASNAVARKFYETLSTAPFNWTMPGIDTIAVDDLEGVRDVLFNQNVIDSVFINNTAWPGTLLLSNLSDQTDFTENLISTGASSVQADSLDDWRNVLYADHSFKFGLQEAVYDVGYDALQLDALTLADNITTTWEVYWLGGNVPYSVANAVQGKYAEDAFAPIINYGGIKVVKLLASSTNGEISNPVELFFEDMFFKQESSLLFGGPGNSNQFIPTTVHRVDDLVTESQGGNNDAQKALMGLSIFKVNNGITVNTNFSNKFWSDRGLMTEANLIYNGFLYTYSVNNVEFTNSYQFLDLKSGISLEVNNNFLPFQGFVQIKFGSDSADNLVGASDDDSLYGAGGADTLDGGGGNDFLSGGNGNDSYIINAGRDIVFDADGSGSVELNGEILNGGDRIGGNVWDSDDGRFRYQLIDTFQGSQLIVIDSIDTEAMVIINNFSSGNLGIELNNSDDPLPPIDTFAPADTAAVGTLDNYSTGSSGNDFYDAGNLYDNVSDFQGGHDVVLLGSDGGFSDRVSTAFGNDIIYGEGGKDFILAGVGFNNAVNGPLDKDTVIGGADVDLINTGVGDDLIIAGEEGENINATNTADQGDWIVADEGNDVAYGTGNQDFITMGTGADLVYAGGGFDVILADGHYTFERAMAVITPVPFIAREHTWNGNSWNTSSINFALLTPGDAFNYTTSITAGGDFEFTPEVVRSTTDRVQDEISDSNDDIVFAGSGPDWISGGPGSDTLYGESDDDIIYGDDLVAMPVGSVYGNDILFGGSGQDMLFGNQGDDTLNGGSGDDMLFGDDLGEPSGNDSLFGGDGVDELYGYGGNDYLSGGAGDDVVLFGGDGDDLIDGNDGNDVLNGESGLDNLRGGQGDDILNGGDDNDFLFGGNGDDVLNGDAGNDVFTGGQGIDQLNGGTGDDVYIATLNQSNSNNPDIITDTSGTDKIKFDELVYPNRIVFTDIGGDLLVQYSPNDAFLVTGGAGGNVVEEYEFIDGRILSYADLTSVTKVAKTSNTLMASTNEITAFNDWYEGDDTVQNLDMLAGDDAVIARGGNDSINGGAGKDVLDGGAGNDTLNGGADNDRLFGATGNDSLNGDDGDDLLAGGDGIDTLSGGNGVDILRGGRDDDNLFGNAGDDFIQGDGGADTLAGGLGHDTYIFRYQDDPAPGVTPVTTIVDSDDAGGNTIKFLGGLNADDITLINDIVTGDVEIQYGHHENTILSSIHIANSAQGEIISLFEFSNSANLSFFTLCQSQPATCTLPDLIYKNDFEQIVTKNIETISQNPMNEFGTAPPTHGIETSVLPLLSSLLIKKLF